MLYMLVTWSLVMYMQSSNLVESNCVTEKYGESIKLNGVKRTYDGHQNGGGGHEGYLGL